MKIALAAAVLSLATTAFAIPQDATVAVAKGGTAKVDKSEAKAEKKAAKQLDKLTAKAEKTPLVAQVLKADASGLTVKTLPLMSPDGLIPAKEKTYETSNATIVVIDGTTKTLADLTPGATVRIQITDDGKAVEHVETKTPGAKKAAKLATPKPAAPVTTN